MKKIGIVLFCSVLSIWAGLKEYVREYTYYASDYDSKVIARTNALEQVKVLLLEEMSKFIISHEQMTTNGSSENYNEDITTYVAGITETHIIDERWNGSSYWVKARISVDPDDVKERLDKVMNNKLLSDQLKSERLRIDKLLEENKRLRTQLTSSKSEKEKQTYVKAYSQGNQRLLATEWFDKGYAETNKELQISYYTKAINLDPKYVYALNNRGTVYHKLGRYEDALTDFRKATDIDPGYALAYFNLGVTSKQMGRVSEAMSYYNKSLTLDSKYAKAYNNRGIIYHDSAKYDKALEDYNNSIHYDPTYVAAFYNRGITYRKKGVLTSAANDFESAIRYDSTHAFSHYYLGLIYEEQGRNQLAIQWFNAYIKIEKRAGQKKWITKAQNKVRAMGGSPAYSSLVN